MISMVNKHNSLWKIWMVLIVFLLAIWTTLLLTRPAAMPTSMTPLSGLMTLKSMAAEAVPYEAAIASPKPTFIEFYADWCTTCQAFAPTLQSVHQSLGDTVNFVMLNIDEPQWQSQIKQYQATGVPHLTLLNTHQTPSQTWVGKVPQTTLLQQIQSSLG